MKRRVTISPRVFFAFVSTVLFVGSFAYTVLQLKQADAAASNIVGLQLQDDNCGGGSGTARYATDVGVWTTWAGDSDNYDPDCLKVYIGNTPTKDFDIRIGIQAQDVNTPCGFLWLFKCGDGGGTIRYTPWASESGDSWSAWVGDADMMDADQWRVILDTRPRYGYTVSDFKLGYQLGDGGSNVYSDGGGCTYQVNPTYYTASSSAGSGWGPWATDNDFNCLKINFLSTSTLNNPTAQFLGTSTAPVANSINLPWDVEYINLTTGCTLIGRNASNVVVDDRSSYPITANGINTTSTIPITEAITYTLTCNGFKSGTTAVATKTISPISQPAALSFKMSPTSGISPGGTSVATISAVNASSCTLKGYDINYAVVDSGYTFTPPPPSATLPYSGSYANDVTYLTSGTLWTVPANWNNSNNTIEVIGGGGGGGGDGGGAAGGNGGTTTFNTSMIAGGGTGGASGSSGTPGGTGGSASGGNTTNTTGGAGSAGTATSGGAGGSTPNSGAGGATRTTDAAGNPGSNYGGGGGGGCNGCGGTGGAGGGAGGYVKSVNVTLTPGANIAYQIGAAGTGGTGSKAGGAGASGVVKITNTYIPTSYITLTSGTTWLVPDDWSPTNSIQVIGGGGGGKGNFSGGVQGGGGGGGGGYAKVVNTSALSAGQVVTIAIGAGGASNTAGTDTYVCSSTSNCSSISGSSVIVGAKGGAAGIVNTGGQGGQASSAKGGNGTTVTNPGAPYAYSGGTGGRGSNGSGSNGGGAGGGGAAGPLGNGGTGGGTNDAEAGGGAGNGGGQNGGWPASCCFGNHYGGAGGDNADGYGGGSRGDSGSGGTGRNGGGGGGADDGGNKNGGRGGDGYDLYDDPADYDGNGGADLNTDVGSGGGGGAASSCCGTVSGAGGKYGGGGAGAPYNGNPGGAGANGVIFISYTPGASLADNTEAHTSTHTVNVTTNFVVSCIPYDGTATLYATSTVTMTGCMLDGVNIPNGGSANFYSQSTPLAGHVCSEYGPQVRGCSSGQLTGNASYVYAMCTDQNDVVIKANNILTATSVRKGSSTAISWDGGNATSCTVTGTNGFNGASSDGVTEITATRSDIVNQKVVYTASCVYGNSTKTASVTVNILPTFINF